MKTYKGLRTGARGAAQVWVLDDRGGHLLDPTPSLNLRNHSPTGFEWNYKGSGPAQLALALLLDATGNDVFALDNYQHFKDDVVSQWPAEGFACSVGDVLRWASDRARMTMAI